MKVRTLAALVLITFLLAGCKTIGITQPTEEPTGIFPTMNFGEVESVPCPDFNVDFYDSEKTHMPTTEEVMSIKQGMFFYDVIEIIGRPHDGFTPYQWANVDIDSRLRWTTVEGTEYVIYFTLPTYIETYREMSIHEFHQYTVVYWEAAVYNPPTQPTVE